MKIVLFGKTVLFYTHEIDNEKIFKSIEEDLGVIKYFVGRHKSFMSTNFGIFSIEEVPEWEEYKKSVIPYMKTL